MSDTAVDSAMSFGEARTGLRSAIDRQTRADVSRDVRRQVTSVCRLAREARIEPERVLVRVKDMLQQSAVLASIDPDLRSEVTTRVISLTITSYFADG